MLSAVSPTQSHDYTEMSRLADYFVVVGYDHDKESELSFILVPAKIYFQLLNSMYFPYFFHEYYVCLYVQH